MLFRRAQKDTSRRVPPLGNAPAGVGLERDFLIPRSLLIFLAGTPFITEFPRQGALGGLTPL